MNFNKEAKYFFGYFILNYVLFIMESIVLIRRKNIFPQEYNKFGI